MISLNDTTRQSANELIALNRNLIALKTTTTESAGKLDAMKKSAETKESAGYYIQCDARYIQYGILISLFLSGIKFPIESYLLPKFISIRFLMQSWRLGSLGLSEHSLSLVSSWVWQSFRSLPNTLKPNCPSKSSEQLPPYYKTMALVDSHLSSSNYSANSATPRTIPRPVSPQSMTPKSPPFAEEENIPLLQREPLRKRKNVRKVSE